MMHIEYILLLGLSIVVFTAAVREMDKALDEIDFERFSVWTCVAGVMAFWSGYVAKLPLFF